MLPTTFAPTRREFNPKTTKRTAPRQPRATPAKPKAQPTRREAIKQLYAVIEAKRKPLRHRNVLEFLRLTDQHDALDTFDDCFVDFSDLPYSEQCAVRLAVSVACIEHAPQLAEVLDAAQPVYEINNLAHYDVPSLSTGGKRRVIIDLSAGRASCGCPATSKTGCWHRRVATLNQSWREAVEQPDYPSDDDLDALDDLSDARPMRDEPNISDEFWAAMREVQSAQIDYVGFFED